MGIGGEQIIGSLYLRCRASRVVRHVRVDICRGVRKCLTEADRGKQVDKQTTVQQALFAQCSARLCRMHIHVCVCARARARSHTYIHTYILVHTCTCKHTHV